MKYDDDKVYLNPFLNHLCLNSLNPNSFLVFLKLYMLSCLIADLKQKVPEEARIVAMLEEIREHLQSEFLLIKNNE